MSNITDITFEEFVELCGEAGISTDNPAQMEQDFRSGRALADVTDALITSQETHVDPYSHEDHIEAMDASIVMLEESATLEGRREMATRLAVHAIRYLAECAYDEGKN